jgi:hypothetical protein
MSKLNSNIIWPTHEQFLAYVNGEMVNEELKSFELAIESDGFLADALEGYRKEPHWIGSISSKVNSSISSKYPKDKSNGFKYYYLAGAAILLVIMGVLLINNMSSTKTQTLADANNEKNENPNIPDAKNTLMPLDNNDQEEKEFSTDNYSNENLVVSGQNEKELNENNNEIVDDEFSEGNFKEEDDDEVIVNFSNKKNNNKNENNISNITARLVVVDVAIGVKDRPNNDKIQKTKIVNGQVVTVDKVANNKQYSQEDLPSYPGGDDALLAEIKGSIKPVMVTIDKQYDRVIGFDFEVSANGQVDIKTLHFMGKPYPQIKDQIKKMIASFPMFMKGKAKGKKGRVRYGIMIKY